MFTSPRTRKAHPIAARAMCALALAIGSATVTEQSVTQFAVSANVNNTVLHNASAQKKQVVTQNIVKKGIERGGSPTLLAVVSHPDIRKDQQEIADATLRSIPDLCRKNLRTFYVKYDNPKRRGLGGESTIILTGNVEADEFRALLIHECGHVIDLGGLKGTPSAGTSAFFDGTQPIYADDASIGFYSISWKDSTHRKKGSKATDFASGYAASDAFEDFAETFAFYALQREAFAKLAKKNPVLQAKYDWMAQNIFASTATLSTSTYIPSTSVPWDVTKLPYTWVN